MEIIFTLLPFDPGLVFQRMLFALQFLFKKKKEKDVKFFQVRNNSILGLQRILSKLLLV